MGDLVHMPCRKTAPRDIVAGETAAILFFTGVRYQRFEDDVALAPAVVTKRRRSTRAKRTHEELVGLLG